MKKIENEIFKYNNVIQKLSEENEEINSKCKKKEDIIYDLNKNYIFLQEKKQENDIMISKNDLINKQLIQQLNNYNLEIQNKNETIQIIEEKIIKAQTNKDHLIDEFEIKSKDIKNLSSKYNIDIIKMKNQSSDNLNDIENLKKEIKQYELKKCNLQKEIKELKVKYDELENKKQEILEINNNFKEYSKEILNNIQFLIGDNENMDYSNLISFKKGMKNNSEKYSQFLSNKITLLNKEKIKNSKLKEELNDIKKNYNQYEKSYKNINRNIFKSPISHKNNIVLTDFCLKELDIENEKIEEMMKEKINEIKNKKVKINEDEKNFYNIGEQLYYYINQMIESNIKDKRENNYIEAEMKEKREIMKDLNKKLLENKTNFDNSLLNFSIVSNGEEKKEENFNNLISNGKNNILINKLGNNFPLNQNEYNQDFIIKKRTYKEYLEEQSKEENKENNSQLININKKIIKNKFLKTNNFPKIHLYINNNKQKNVSTTEKNDSMNFQKINLITPNPFLLTPKNQKSTINN
jgi:hypothetical protein